MEVAYNSQPDTVASIRINGKDHPVYEYFQDGFYRITIGEFTDPLEAGKLKDECRKAGYEHAFVGVFTSE